MIILKKDTLTSTKIGVNFQVMVFDDNDIHGFSLETQAGWDHVESLIPEILKVLGVDEKSTFNDLTTMQQRFIIGFALRDLKGWSKYRCLQFARKDRITLYTRNAAISAHQMSRHQKVKPWLDKINWDRVKALGFNSNRIIEEELSIAYSDVTKYLDDDGLLPFSQLKKLPSPVRRAIKSVEVIIAKDGSKRYKLQLWDKGNSLNRLEKVKGLQQEKMDIYSRSENVNVNIDTEMDAVEASRIYAQMLKK